MQIQTINYDEGSLAALLPFLSLITFFMVFFFVLTAMKDYFKRPKKSRSFENLSELEKKIWDLTKQNTKFNAKKIMVDSPLLLKSKRRNSEGRCGKTVIIQENINQYYYINVNLKPSVH